MSLYRDECKCDSFHPLIQMAGGVVFLTPCCLTPSSEPVLLAGAVAGALLGPPTRDLRREPRLKPGLIFEGKGLCGVSLELPRSMPGPLWGGWVGPYFLGWDLSSVRQARVLTQEPVLSADLLCLLYLAALSVS